MMDMARFRNRLVHFDLAIDDDLLWEILQDGPGDLERFLREYGEFLGKV